MKGELLTVGIEVEVARGKDLLCGTLHVDTSVVTELSGAVVLSDGRHSLSLGCEVESGEVEGQVSFTDLLKVDVELNEEVEHGLFGG